MVFCSIQFLSRFNFVTPQSVALRYEIATTNWQQLYTSGLPALTADGEC